MTSPSPRKLRTTLRSTRRSIFGRALALTCVSAFVVGFASPSWSAEPATARLRPAFASSNSRTRIAAVSLPGDAKATDDESSAPARPAAKRRPSRVIRTQFQEPAPEGAVRPGNGSRDFEKPFRKIAEILPYDTYDPVSSADDRQRYPSNLCPCPEGQDCAESCPREKSLRRIGRAEDEPDRPFIPRNFAHIHYCWEPTNMYHNPIYFEDVPLERYGHTRHYLIQPVFSGAKFAVQLLGLPYQMTIYPICSRQYTLGYYRPGECAPFKYYQIPLNACAALVEAGFVTGGYFLFAPGVGP